MARREKPEISATTPAHPEAAPQAAGLSSPPTLMGRLIGRYLMRFRRPESISFGEAFRQIRRVLVIPEQGVVGALFATPTLRALRQGFPDCKIAVLAREEDRDLLDGAPEIDKVIGYDLPGGLRRAPSFLALGKRLRSHRFDVSILLDREFDIERAFLCYLTKATVRAGLQSDESYPFFNLEMSRNVSGRVRANLGLEVVSLMGVDVSGIELRWEVSEREKRLAEQLVHFRKPREEELLIGFDPGPGRSGTSISSSQQGRLLDRLCTDYQARAILLTAPEHHQCAIRLESLAQREPIVVQQRRMRDVVSLLGECDLFVSGNTDLTYFAVAMGIPTVSMMTPAEAEDSAMPRSDTFAVVELVSGERFPIEEFMERTQAVLLGNGG